METADDLRRNLAVKNKEVRGASARRDALLRTGGCCVGEVRGRRKRKREEEMRGAQLDRRVPQGG